MSYKGMFIHGSFSFENQYIPTKALRAECRALDESGYAVWVKETAQSKTDRVLLKLVGKEIEYVSGPVFEKSLEGCIKGFKKKLTLAMLFLLSREKVKLGQRH